MVEGLLPGDITSGLCQNPLVVLNPLCLKYLTQFLFSELAFG